MSIFSRTLNAFHNQRETLREAMEEFLETCGSDREFDREVRRLADEVQPYSHSQPYHRKDPR